MKSTPNSLIEFFVKWRRLNHTTNEVLEVNILASSIIKEKEQKIFIQEIVKKIKLK